MVVVNLDVGGSVPALDLATAIAPAPVGKPSDFDAHLQRAASQPRKEDKAAQPVTQPAKATETNSTRPAKTEKPKEEGKIEANADSTADPTEEVGTDQTELAEEVEEAEPDASEVAIAAAAAGLNPKAPEKQPKATELATTEVTDAAVEGVKKAPKKNGGQAKEAPTTDAAKSRGLSEPAQGAGNAEATAEPRELKDADRGKNQGENRAVEALVSEEPGKTPLEEANVRAGKASSESQAKETSANAEEVVQQSIANEKAVTADAASAVTEAEPTQPKEEREPSGRRSAGRAKEGEPQPTALDATATAPTVTQVSAEASLQRDGTKRELPEAKGEKKEPESKVASAEGASGERAPKVDTQHHATAMGEARQGLAETGRGATTPGEGTASGVSVDAQRFVQRVAKAFAAAEQRGGPLRLRLSPPELGLVKLELVVRDGKISAKMEAENPVARQLLLDHLPQLRERLTEQNLRVERFDIDLMDRGMGNESRQSGDQTAPQRPHYQAAKSNHSDEAGPEAIGAAAGMSRSEPGRLNVVV